MDKKIDNEKNGGISRGEAAAHCFEREVAKTPMDNVHFPFVEEPTKESRYNPYKEKMFK